MVIGYREDDPSRVNWEDMTDEERARYAPIPESRMCAGCTGELDEYYSFYLERRRGSEGDVVFTDRVHYCYRCYGRHRGTAMPNELNAASEANWREVHEQESW